MNESLWYHNMDLADHKLIWVHRVEHKIDFIEFTGEVLSSGQWEQQQEQEPRQVDSVFRHPSVSSSLWQYSWNDKDLVESLECSNVE